MVGLDNFATGHQRNLDEVQHLVTRAQWAPFSSIEGDICSLADLGKAQPLLGTRPRTVWPKAWRRRWFGMWTENNKRLSSHARFPMRQFGLIGFDFTLSHE